MNLSKIKHRIAQTLAHILGGSVLAIASPPDPQDSGPSHQKILRTDRIQDKQGQWKSVTREYVELADGLNYQAASGAWTRSNPEFRSTNGWAVAAQCQHSAAVNLQLRRSGGVLLTLPGGTQLRSHFVGLSYLDTATGESVLFAEPKERRGKITASNQVVFRDALDDIQADVRYTMNTQAFEQDIILREAPPRPEQFGLNPATTRLEVLTEFLDAAQPRIRLDSSSTQHGQDLKQRNEIESDQTLDFGSMTAGPGRVFAENLADSTIASVSKRWVRLSGRQFLIESVSYTDIVESLRTLEKPHEASTKPAPKSRPSRFRATQDGANREIPSTTDWQSASQPTPIANHSEESTIAENGIASRGVVLDYLFTLSGSSSLTRFRADTTYYISGNLTLNGAVFEGGTVLKYAPGASLAVEYAVSEETSPYRPVQFTAATDDSVGDPIALGTATFPRPSPTTFFGSPCLWIKGTGSGSFYPCTLDVSNFRFAHASIGLRLQGGPVHTLRNSQFRDCATAIELIGGESQSMGLSWLNGLAVRCNTAIASSSPSATLSAQHLTIASVAKLRSGILPSSADFRNCLIAGVPDLAGLNLPADKGNAVVESSNGIFANSGLGAFYLPSGSPHSMVCQTNSVEARLLSDLECRTTHIPQLLQGSIRGTRLLTPHTKPHPPLSRLDRGYHYPSLDFLISNLQIQEGKVQVAPGTVLGVYGPAGLVLGQNSTFLAEGLPQSPVIVTRLQSIQELTYPNSANSPENVAFLRTANETLITADATRADGSEVSTRYAEMSVPAGTGSLVSGGQTLSTLRLKHTQAFGGSLQLAPVISPTRVAQFDNVLLHGTMLQLGSISNSLSAQLRRATIRSCRLELSPWSTDTWDLTDSILHEVDFPVPAMGLSLNYNAFCRATNINASGQRALILPATLPGSNSIALNGIQWSKGPYGTAYYSTQALRDRGSVTAPQVGLFHHTTSPTQEKESTSRIDLGFHYAATLSGTPTDTDRDGLSDLEEDLDGDGLLAIAPAVQTILNLETATNSADTDGDGFTDLEERRNGTNPRRADLFPEEMLAEWTFNTPNFSTSKGEPALAGSKSTLDPMTWDETAAQIAIIPATAASPQQFQWLAYPWRSAQGKPMISPTKGTLQFWFKPNWSSRSTTPADDGSATPRKLVMIQAPGDETEYWGLQLNATGNIATFSSLRSNNSTPKSISWNISLERGVWAQLTLTYDGTRIDLWKNGQRLQPSTLAGTESWPADISKTQRIYIGGWENSNVPRTANGAFEAIRTFSYVLKPETIQTSYATVSTKDTDNDGLPDLLELRSAGFSPGNRDSDSDGLPDKWEYEFFGDNRAQPQDDPDLDGANNLQEFIQGRNPRTRDTKWQPDQFAQSVRNASDLINIDFATYSRFAQTGEHSKAFDPTVVQPVVASLDPTNGERVPSSDLWNIVTPDQLLNHEPSSGSIVLRNASGGVTQLRFMSTYGPIQKWSGEECAATIAAILSNRRPETLPDYRDNGVAILRPALPKLPIATTLEGWCPFIPPVEPIHPNALQIPNPDPLATWQPPAWWWFGSQAFHFQTTCGGPITSTRLLALQNPLHPGTGTASDEDFDALKALSQYPPCAGSLQQFLRPAFQSGSEFANTSNDVGLPSVTIHPMMLDYLTTTEETPEWKALLQSNGYDLREAHSRLQLSGIQPGPWRVFVYSATENDQRYCPIVLQAATSTFIPFSNIPVWQPSEADGLIPVSDLPPERHVESINPGPRHTGEFIQGRHYVQSTVDIGSDGILNLQFLKNAALNGMQLVQLRPLESAEWAGPIDTTLPSSLILRWKPVPTALEYTVQRSDSTNGPWTEIASNLRSTSHRDSTVAPLPNGQPKSYWYRILAINERYQSTSVISKGTVTQASNENRPPVLSRIQPLGPAFQGEPFNLGIEDIRSHSVVSDFERDPIEFRIERILTGSLSVDGLATDDASIRSANATNSPQFLIRKSTRIQWTPSVDLPGLVAALEIRAFDGMRFSDQTAVLTIRVEAPNQVVWWGSNLSETAGNGEGINTTYLEEKYPGRRRYIRSDPKYWSSGPSPVNGPDNGRLLNVVQLVAKEDVTLALKGDGTVWSWGHGDPRLGLGNPVCPQVTGNCDLPWFAPSRILQPHLIQFPEGASRIQQISVGLAHAAAVTIDGSVYLWGSNPTLTEGMNDQATVALDILPGASLRTATTDGPYDPNQPQERANAERFRTQGTGTPTKVPNIQDVVSVACSDHAVAILTREGTVLDWGTLSYLDTRELRFGPGGSVTTLGAHRRLLNSATPTPRQFPSKPVQIAAGANYFLAVLESGEVYAWGSNDSGGFADANWSFDITDPNKVGTLVPRRIPGLAKIRTVTACDSYAVAVAQNGAVFEWGRSLTSSQTIQPPRPVLNLPRIQTAAVTGTIAFAIDEEGHGWAWGHNGDFGVTPEYSSLSGMIQPENRQFDIDRPVPIQFLPKMAGASASNPSVLHAIASLLPAAPQNVVAHATPNTISLNWAPFPGATAYRVYRSANPLGEFLLLQTVRSTANLVQETQDATALNGQLLYYQVTAVIGSTETDPSMLAWARIQPAPATITGFTLTPRSRAIALAWCPSLGAQHYEVLRAGPFPSNTPPASTSTFTTQFTLDASKLASQLPAPPDCNSNKLQIVDSGLVPGSWYAYRIRAVNESGSTPYTEGRQSPLTPSFGPLSPTITSIVQNNTTAVLQFQTNHSSPSTQWIVQLMHHRSLDLSDPCLPGSSPVEPGLNDTGWVLDRTVVLPDSQGATMNQTALSLVPSSPRRVLLLDGLPTGVWHKVIIVTETPSGLSPEVDNDGGNVRIFRTVNTAATPIELLTAASGRGYIYIRYRNDAGFAPSALSPRPLPCPAAGAPAFDNSICLQFTEFPWDTSGETESWLLNLPALPNNTPYRLRVTPGASADISRGIDLSFQVQPRVAPGFPINVTVGDSRVRLDWYSEQYSGLFAGRKFVVERIAATENGGALPKACDPAVRWELRAEGNGYQFEEKGLQNGSEYQYRIIAIQPETGELDWQVSPSLTPSKSILENDKARFESSLTAIPRNSAVDLAWLPLTTTHGQTSTVHYSLFHFASTNQPPELLTEFSSNDPANPTAPIPQAFSHHPLQNNSTHFYQLRATLDDGMTVDSSLIQATPKATSSPRNPESIAIRRITGGQPNARYLLNWDPIDGAQSYQVYARIKGTNLCIGQTLVGKTHTEFVSAAIPASTDLEFFVTAIGATGSESFQVSCATTPFLTPNLFGPVNQPQSRSNPEVAEFIDLIVPKGSNNGTGLVYTPTNITLRASLAFSGREIRAVEFFCNDEIIGTAKNPPYTLDWPNPPSSGSSPLRLTAVAVCSDGSRKSSPERFLSVRVRPPLSEFALQPPGFQLRSGSQTFEVQHGYNSQNLADGILGRGWSFSFERAQLQRPDLSTGWQVVGTGLANLFAAIQETGTSHEIKAILPNGTTLRFSTSPRFRSNETKRDLEWLQILEDPEETLGSVQVDFTSVDGSGATLSTPGSPELLGFELGTTTTIDGHQLMGCRLMAGTAPFAPNQFRVRLPSGWSYDYRTDQTNSFGGPQSLRLYQISDPQGGFFRFATQRADGTELVGASFSHVDIRRVAIQAFTSSGILIRECWLDRLNTASPTWALYDSIGIQAAQNARITNATATLPGSVASPAISRFVRNANRLEGIEELNSRDEATYHTHRFAYTSIPGDPVQGVSSQDLLTSITNPTGVTIVRNTYELQGGLFVLTSQLDARGTTRTLGYSDSSRVSATVTGPNQPAVTESIQIASNGETTEVRDATGVRSLQVRDDRGRLTFEGTSSTQPGTPILATASYRYNDQDLPIERSDSMGNTTNYEFTGEGQLTAESDPNQNTTSYQYSEKANPDGSNPVGTLLSVTDPAGNTTEFQYNSRGQPTVSLHRMVGTSGLSMTRFEYFESNSSQGRIGDLRRIYQPLSGVCQSIDQPFPMQLPPYATEFSYDENGNTQTSSQLRSIRLVQTNAMNIATETISWELITTGTTYDAANRQTSSSRSQSQVDSSFNRVPATDVLLQKRQTFFDHAGRELQARDALGRQVFSTYDVKGNLIQTTYPDGTVQRTLFDSLGRRTLVQDRAKPSQPATSVDPATGLTTAPASEYLFDSAGRTLFTRKRANITLRLQEEVLYAGYSTSNPKQYTCTNLTPAAVWSTNILSVTRTVYDATGRQRYQVNHLGGLTETVYDPANRVVATSVYDTTKFPLDNTPINTSGSHFLQTRFGYDSAGNQLWIIEPSAGNPTGESSEPTLATEFKYDALNRVIETFLPAHRGGRTSLKTQYDALGNRSVETDENGIATRYAYDVQGRLLKVIQDWNPSLPESQQNFITRYEYDELGNLIAQTDAEGRRTRYEYDAQGRRTCRILPGGSLLSLPGSGEIERVEYLTTPSPSGPAGVFVTGQKIRGLGGSEVLRQLDVVDRLAVTVVRPNPTAAAESTANYEYSDWGTPTRIREYRGTPLPSTPTRLTEWTYQAGTRRLESKSTPEGQLFYQFNPAQKVARITAKLNTAFLTGSLFEYDPLGRLASVRQLASTEDILGSTVARYQYDPNGRPGNVELGNGVFTRLEYNSRNHLTRVSHKRGSTPTSPDIASFNYDSIESPLDPDGLRRSVIESFAGLSSPTMQATNSVRSRKVNYGFDRLRRLVREEIQPLPSGPGTLLGTAGSLAYQLDKVGNRITRTPSTSLQALVPTQGPMRFDLGDRPDSDTNPSTRSTWFDAAGNTIQSFTSPTTAIATGDGYDSQGHLVRRQVPGTATLLAFRYDEHGNRVGKRITGTGFDTDLSFLVDELNPSGYPQVLAEWKVQGGLTNLARTYQVGTAVISQQDGPEGLNRRYLLPDATGSTRMLADASGNPVNVFHYDAFGRILGRLDWSSLGTSGSNWVSATSLNTVQPTQFLYAGEYWDEDLQLAYHRARYYSPNLGRFWTMDSDEGNQVRPRSLHKFLYAEADPINLRDPSGHSSLSDVAASIVGRATLAARSTGPFATGIRAAIGILTLASAAHDPEAFVASFESPNAAASVLALDAGFVLYYTKRAVNFTTGFVAARLEIQPAIEAVLAQSAQRVRQLDADALIGFRGSTARGYKGPHKNNDPFDPDHFDVDGFVVSDKLAAKIPKIRGARFADASSSPELAAEQQRIDGELRSKLKGLKDSDFTFRVFTYQEYYRKFKDGKLIED